MDNAYSHLIDNKSNEMEDAQIDNCNANSIGYHRGRGDNEDILMVDVKLIKKDTDSKELAFKFDKIIALNHDEKFAKKRLLSSSIRYTCLLSN